MPNHCFGYEFHPVGQGLFASGYLTKCHKKYCYRPRRIRHLDCGSDFTWVYDCGTSSGQSLLTKAISSYKKGFDAPNPTIDLVAISHFDSDHISGLLTLLNQFRVKTLLLPYMPLWQRLVVAFNQGIDTRQDFIQFFINPVAYILGQSDVTIGQIVFVQDDQEGEQPPENVSGHPEGNEPLNLDFEHIEPSNDDQMMDDSYFQSSASKSNSSVHYARNGGILSVSGVWEFIPYNDATVTRRSTSQIGSIRKFRELVRSKIRDLFGPNPGTALKDIKDAYDNYFGKSPERRNIISLFLYAGPMSMTRIKQRIGGYYFRRWGSSHKCSILYTGDGYLNTGARFNQVTRHLGNHRMNCVSCFQVMHHGAERNWHKGIAKRISPDCSIFSSDPTHKGLGHPHAAVLRDFWLYGPVQVDKHHGASIDGYIY